MDEKGSFDSGSPLMNSENDSPPVSGGYSSGGGAGDSLMGPPPPVVDMNMNIVGPPPGGAIGDEMVNGAGGRSGIDLMGKKKRGRPRKYDQDGNLRPSYIKSPQPRGEVPPPPGFFSITSPSASFPAKRGRGRPAGSGNWQFVAPFGELFASTAAGDFTPHVVPVNRGEDVAEKLSKLAQRGPRGICVLSANGAVSTVSIRQPCSSGGTLTYEGRFEILSLTGSYTVAQKNGMVTRTGGLSVSLAGPDGRVIGGAIAGVLTAAGPIQMVVGSFTPNANKPEKKKHHYESRIASPLAYSVPAVVTPALPISQAAPNGGIFPTPPQLHVLHQDNPIVAAAVGTALWNGAEASTQQRPSPDINVSAPME